MVSQQFNSGPDSRLCLGKHRHIRWTIPVVPWHISLCWAAFSFLVLHSSPSSPFTRQKTIKNVKEDISYSGQIYQNCPHIFRLLPVWDLTEYKLWGRWFFGFDTAKCIKKVCFKCFTFFINHCIFLFMVLKQRLFPSSGLEILDQTG